MDERIEPDAKSEITGVRTRPVFLTALCLGGFVYFGMVSLLFLSVLLNAGMVAEVMNKYIPDGVNTKSQLLYFTAGGFVLHGIGFRGLLMIWKLRKTGYLLLGVSSLVAAVYLLFNPDLAVTSAILYIVFIFLFGLFYQRLR